MPAGEQVALLDGHPEEVYHVSLLRPGLPFPSAPHERVQAAEAAGGMGETHVLAASSESLFVWDLRAGRLSQQADAPGTSGSTLPPGGRTWQLVTHSMRVSFSMLVIRNMLLL